MQLRKVYRIVLGFLLIALGILGLILPIMPGWAFLIPGLLVLAEFFPPVERLVNWAKAKAEKTLDSVRR